MKDHQTTALKCWHCATELDGHMNADPKDNDAPQDGSASLCMYCGAWAVFVVTEDSITLREPTSEEWYEFTTDIRAITNSMMMAKFRKDNDIGVPQSR